MSAIRSALGQGFKPRVQWCRGGEFNRPSRSHSRVKSAVNAMFARYVKPNPSFWRPHGEASVVALLLGRGPHAVFWRVVAVYVDSLYRKVIGVSARFGPTRKVLEVGPVFTNGYAAPSVVRPLPMTGALTSRAHSLPNAVNSTAGLSVRFGPLAGPSASLAPARFRFSFSKVAADNVAEIATRALAAPNGSTPSGVPALRYNAPKPKGLASKVYKSRVFCHASAYKDGADFAMGDLV